VGFGSFVANAVTCLQVAGITIPKKFEIWYQHGVKICQNVLDSLVLPANAVFVLGNNVLYPLALYTTLQIAEFFGTTAVAHKLEEFCHSPIFGLKSANPVWILGQNESQVYQRLQMLGLRLSYIELYNSDILTQLFESIFCVQNLMLLLAERHGLEELQYVTMKDVLKASSDIIYYDRG
jgi:hypothetical protein